jgi:hypothetical protein
VLAPVALLAGFGCIRDETAGEPWETFDAHGSRATSPIRATPISPSPVTHSLTEPRLTLGGSDAPADHAFGRIRGGVFDSVGRLWVADGMASELVRIGAEGGTDRIGGRGRGPGEFLQPSVLGLRHDSVVVFDVEQRRVVLVEPGTDGSVTRRLEPATWGGSPRFMVGLGRGGAYVFIPFFSGFRPTGEAYDPRRPGWVSVTPVQVVAEHGPDSSVILFSEPLADLYFDGERDLRDPFSGAWVAGSVGDTVAVVGAVGGDILVGALDGSERVALNLGAEPGATVSDSLVERVQRRLHEVAREGRRSYAPLEALESRGYPERMPVFDRLVVSSDGVLWVRRKEDRFRDGPVRWEVVDLEGERLGTVRVPAGEEILAASPHRVATLADDSLGAPVVRVYTHPLGPPAAGTP